MPTIQFVNFSKDVPKASKSVSLDEINSKEDLVKLAKQTMLDHEENWRAGYDVSTEGALGDYPEEF